MKIIKLIKIGCFLISLVLSSAVYAGSISGKVVDIQGNPLDNVRVEAFNYSESNGWRNDEITSTDANGVFHFDNLEHNKYRLKFTDRNNLNRYEFYDNTSRFNNAKDTDVANNQNIQLQSITLGDIGTGTISGTITDTSGESISGMSVALSYVNTGEYTSTTSTTTTDNQGRYTFTNIQSNNYELSLFGSVARTYTQSVNLEAGDILNNIDFQVELHGSIKGTVRDSNGNPLGLIKYFFYTSKDGKWIKHIPNTTPLTSNVGGFKIDRLPPGKYKLLFISPNNYEFYNNATTVDDASTITILSNQETIADIRLGDLETGSVSGKLTDKTTGKAIASSKITASIRQNSVSGGTYWMPITFTTTDIDGKYLFSKLTPNNYLISSENTYEPNSGEPSDSNVIYLADNDSKYEINVTAGNSNTNEDISLSFAHGSLEGSVVDTSGIGLENIKIDAYRIIERYNTPNRWEKINTTYTNGNGDYSFENSKNITIGEYRLKFTNLDNNTYEYNGNAKELEQAELIVIDPYQNITINHVFGKEVIVTLDENKKSGSGSISQTFLLLVLLLLLIVSNYRAYYKQLNRYFRY